MDQTLFSILGGFLSNFHILSFTSVYCVLYLVVFPANFTNRRARSCFRALPEIRTNWKTKTLKIIINAQLFSKLEFCSHILDGLHKIGSLWICCSHRSSCNIHITRLFLLSWNEKKGTKVFTQVAGWIHLKWRFHRRWSRRCVKHSRLR